METLKEYADLAAEDVKQAVRDGETVRKEIRANAPKDTGEYAKSWAVKKTKETSSSLTLTVHSKNRYQLAPSAGVRPREAERRTGSGQSPYRPGGGKRHPAAGGRDRKEPEGWINFWIF